MNIDVKLAKKYVGDSLPAVDTEDIRSWRGIRADYATAAESFYRGTAVIDEQGCVAVAEVDDGSQAWQAGVRPGLFVTHVGQERVSTPDQFYAAAEAHDGPLSLRFTTTVGDGDTATVPP
jgi:S1-C subfamily serine protease